MSAVARAAAAVVGFLIIIAPLAACAPRVPALDDPPSKNFTLVLRPSPRCVEPPPRAHVTPPERFEEHECSPGFF